MRRRDGDPMKTPLAPPPREKPVLNSWLLFALLAAFAALMYGLIVFKIVQIGF